MKNNITMNNLNKQCDSGLYLNDIHFFYFELFILLSIVTLIVFFVWLSNKKNTNGTYVNCADYVVSMLFLITVLSLIILNSSYTSEYTIFNGHYVSNSVTVFFKNVSLVLFLIFLVLMKWSVNDHNKRKDFEFPIILFISFFTGLLILNSNDFVTLFFLIELQSLCFYIIVSSKQTSSFSTESGLKYFILGSFSSCLILFGISMIYGFTGLLNFSDLSLFISNISNNANALHFFVNSGIIFGLLFVAIGLLFKLGAVPFHFWMPDVYEGAPLLAVIYLSTIAKIPVVYIYYKIYVQVFFGVFYYFHILFLISGILSIVIGSIAAIYQIKIKRLLTYSMINSTGYILVALSFQGFGAIWACTFYLLTSMITLIGLFACFLCLKDRITGLQIKKITSLINLVEINPALAFCFFVLLLSAAGTPPFLGFYGKLLILYFCIQQKMYFVAFLIVILSAISIFYSIRLIKFMYFNRSRGWIFYSKIPFSVAWVISAITILNVFFFVYPDILFKITYLIALYFFL